ncbi:uncharacterized protein LOC120935825 isoform X2 [Rana temporaria]|uniref:uncharacterized protein LOC120935825 isoform X2 n=1 Tax=Rana temporaria TaxID=8407 RepID=UPI001AADE981|nr:uncharacterized protein LOC120935825 isoform X2 [Rana temporaria]
MDPVLQKVDEAIILIALRRRQEEERSRRRHQYWVHPMVSHRVSTGYFHNLYSELRIYPNKCINFTRMSVARFDDLLERLRPRLTRMDTAMHNSVSPEERLLVTLRFLATGQLCNITPLFSFWRNNSFQSSEGNMCGNMGGIA